MKIGLEKEFFVLDRDGKPAVCPKTLPADECGWLAEARGQPFTDVADAIFSLRADVYRLAQTMKKHNEKVESDKQLVLSDVPCLKVDRDVRLTARRTHMKGLVQYQNLHGYTRHRNTITEAVAGVHVSFTKPSTKQVKEEKIEYNANWDWASLFLALDKEFAAEIKAAKRNPGFYELKYDGRVEYRSLPADVNFDKLYDVLTKLLS